MKTWFVWKISKLVNANLLISFYNFNLVYWIIIIYLKSKISKLKVVINLSKFIIGIKRLCINVYSIKQYYNILFFQITLAVAKFFLLKNSINLWIT